MQCHLVKNTLLHTAFSANLPAGLLLFTLLHRHLVDHQVCGLLLVGTMLFDHHTPERFNFKLTTIVVVWWFARADLRYFVTLSDYPDFPDSSKVIPILVEMFPILILFLGLCTTTLTVYKPRVF